MEIFRLVFSPIEENTYILSDKTGKCAVIDCGCYNKAEFGKLTGLLDKKYLNPVLLLNTHCHLDHIFGNGMFLEKYKLGTFYHKSEEKNRRDAVMHAQFFGLTMANPPEPAGLIADGENVTFGTVNLLALHVPGHTTGSLAFYSKEGGVVFTGDTLFSGSIGRSDLPGGNHEILIESIRSKLFTLPPDTVVYPGHGEATTIGDEIRTNPYFK
jgi:glyoxylase-like metal-dependent hydrolase (beta-lactamase superfamily II)